MNKPMNMINEFGVPMNDMEIANSNIKPHEKMLADSGLEMQFWGGIAGFALGKIFSDQAKATKISDDQKSDRWEDTQQYKDFQTQNKQLTSQISGLESSLANLNTNFGQQRDLAAERAEFNQSTINNLSSQLGQYQASQAERVAAADAGNSYNIASQTHKGVKINQGEDLGKTGKVKPNTRSYFNRDSMRIGSLTDQSVNV
jgi:hypothetical protein